MNKQLKLFGLPTQEYRNKVGSTVFEISGTLNELRSIYKDIRMNYLQTRNTPFDIPDGRVVYIKCCHAIKYDGGERDNGYSHYHFSRPSYF